MFHLTNILRYSICQTKTTAARNLAKVETESGHVLPPREAMVGSPTHHMYQHSDPDVALTLLCGWGQVDPPPAGSACTCASCWPTRRRACGTPTPFAWRWSRTSSPAPSPSPSPAPIPTAPTAPRGRVYGGGDDVELNLLVGRWHASVQLCTRDYRAMAESKTLILNRNELNSVSCLFSFHSDAFCIVHFLAVCR